MLDIILIVFRNVEIAGNTLDVGAASPPVLVGRLMFLHKRQRCNKQNMSYSLTVDMQTAVTMPMDLTVEQDSSSEEITTHESESPVRKK